MCCVHMLWSHVTVSGLSQSECMFTTHVSNRCWCFLSDIITTLTFWSLLETRYYAALSYTRSCRQFSFHWGGIPPCTTGDDGSSAAPRWAEELKPYFPPAAPLFSSVLSIVFFLFFKDPPSLIRYHFLYLTSKQTWSHLKASERTMTFSSIIIKK